MPDGLTATAKDATIGAWPNGNDSVCAAIGETDSALGAAVMIGDGDGAIDKEKEPDGSTALDVGP